MKRVLLIVMALVCAALTACAAKPSVTVVLDWLPNTNHTGLYVALDKGYFKDNGLDVEIVQPPEDGALALVAAGKAQFGVSFQDEMAAALASNEPLPVTAVATIIQHNTSGILSAKETGIASPKQLEGKRYATWNTPVEKAVLKEVMQKDGGDVSKVEFINSTVTDVITALKTDIDAVWVYYAWDGIAAQINNFDTNYFAFSDIEPVLDYYTPVIVSGNEFLRDNPDMAGKFLSAVKKGYEFAIENPSEAVDILIKYAPEINRDIAQKSQEYLSGQYKAEVEQWGYIDPARWNAFYAWLYDNGLIEKDLQGVGFTDDYLE